MVIICGLQLVITLGYWSLCFWNLIVHILYLFIAVLSVSVLPWKDQDNSARIH